MAIVVYLGAVGLLVKQLLAGYRPGLTKSWPVTLADDGEREILVHAHANLLSPELSGLLIPVSPDEQRLPGIHVLWQMLARELSAGEPVVANGFDGLQLIGVPNQAEHGSLFRLDLGQSVQALYHHAGHLYLLKSNGHLVVVDVTVPQQPVALDEVSGLEKVLCMAGEGSRLYLMVTRGKKLSPQLVVLDLTRPERPEIQQRLNLPPTARTLALFDEFLGVYDEPADRETGLLHLFRLDPDLSAAETLQGIRAAEEHVSHGDLWFVAGKPSGLLVQTPFAGEIQEEPVDLEIPGHLYDMSRAGGLLFAWGGSHSSSHLSQGQLYVIDIGQPDRPVLGLSIDSQYNKLCQVKAIGPCFYLFTRFGSLYVYNRPPAREHMVNRVTADFLLPRGDDGLFAIGRAPTTSFVPGGAGLPNVTLVPWPRSVLAAGCVDDELLLLEEGRLQILKIDADGRTLQGAAIDLPAGLRWMVTAGQRIYLGGDELLLVARRDAKRGWQVAASHALAGIRSFSALLVADNLLVAAGTDGLLRFSLEDPDHPLPRPAWQIPAHYAGLVDLRRIAACGDRIYAAAGSAGLLTGKFAADGRLELSGRMPLDGRAHDLLLFAGICLVATEKNVHCIDARQGGALQKLGTIRLSSPAALARIGPVLWAGRTGEDEFMLLPVPRIVPSDTFGDGRAYYSLPPLPAFARYRFHLFNSDAVSEQFTLVMTKADRLVVERPARTGGGERE